MYRNSDGTLPDTAVVLPVSPQVSPRPSVVVQQRTAHTMAGMHTNVHHLPETTEGRLREASQVPGSSSMASANLWPQILS